MGGRIGTVVILLCLIPQVGWALPNSKDVDRILYDFSQMVAKTDVIYYYIKTKVIKEEGKEAWEEIILNSGKVENQVFSKPSQ
jgi:hypothetical protein